MALFCSKFSAGIVILLFILLLAPADAMAQETPQAKEASADKAAEDEAEASRKRRDARMRALRPTAELKIGDKQIIIAHAPTAADSVDFRQLAELKAGGILQFTQSQAIKLKTGFDLKFGPTVIRAGNIAKDYPGVYSLWLKKTASGWALVFNGKPDVFGTQHDPGSDVAEIPLTHEEKGHEAKFKVTLTENLLTFAWGQHQFTAAFALAAPASAAGPEVPADKAVKSATAEPRPADAKSLKNPVLAEPASLAEGKAAYLRSCQRCHGADGRALENIDFEATDLTNPSVWIYGATDGEMFVSTKFGAGDEMPPFAGKLNDDEIWKIVNHIRSLWPKGAPADPAGGNP